MKEDGKRVCNFSEKNDMTNYQISKLDYYVNITANSFDMTDNCTIAPSTSYKPWIPIVKSDRSGHMKWQKYHP
jgi:hypothetical protein